METAIVPLPTRVKQELEIRREDIEEVLPDWMNFKRFANMALMAVTKTPKLVECEFPTIYLSILECARLGLYPDGRQAALVPYRGKATLLPMVQGITELILRSPKIVNVDSKVVYEGDEFEWSESPAWIKHKPTLDPSRSTNEITHSYAKIWRSGFNEAVHEVVDRAEIEKARQSSAAPNSPAWVNWEGEQSKKVALKRLSKKVDMTPEAQALISWDHAIYGDPRMQTPLLEGPSPEYQNMDTKIKTEQGLIELKEKIKPKDNGDEPEEEDEVIEFQPRDEHHWEDHIKDFIIDGGFVRGDTSDEVNHRLVGILDLSPFTEIEYGKLALSDALAWVLAWEQVKDKHQRMGAPNRAVKVLAMWNNADARTALAKLAAEKIPPDTQQPLI